MAAPTITSISPTSAPPGTPVTIKGTNFTEDTNWVKFGSVSCGLSFQVLSPTCIVAVAPDNSGTVSVTVNTPDGTSGGASFYYSTYTGGGGGAAGGDPPTVTGLSISESANDRGLGGDTVVITGTEFTTAWTVWFGDRQADFTIDSDTQITAISPPGTGTVHVQVSNPYGTSTTSSADEFSYPDVPTPTLSNLDPDKAFWGRPVVITGTYLDTVQDVLFGTVGAQFFINSATQITATVPYGGVGTVSVTVENVTGTSNGLNFTYAQANNMVPQNLAATALIDAVLLKWDPILTLEGVTFRIYSDANNPPTTLVGEVEGTTATIPQSSTVGLRYFRVSSVDSNGTESAKSSVVSCTALATASTLADHSIAQAKLALDIRPPKLASSAPSLPDTEFPIGSTYFNTTDLHLYKTTDGTSWSKLVDAGDIVANSITSGVVAAGAIGADELAANSVYAKHLTVAVRGAALNIDPDCADETAWSLWSGSTAVFATVSDGKVGNTVMRSAGAGVQTWMNGAQKVPVDPAKVYRVRTWLRQVSGTTTSSCYMGVALFDANGDNITGAGTQWYYAASSVVPGTTWTEYVGEFGPGTSQGSIPSNARTMVPLVILSYGGGDRVFEAQDVRIEEEMPAELIVDGTITAGKIATGTITSTSACIASLNAGWISTGTMSCDRLSGGTITGQYISGGYITGGTIRTAPSGERCELHPSGHEVAFYNTSGTRVGCLYLYNNIRTLIASTVTNGEASLSGYGSSIVVGGSGMSVYVSANSMTVDCDLYTTNNGGFIPGQWQGGTYPEGTYCNDNYTVTKRLKIYYNNSNNRFGVYDDSGNAHYVTTT